MGRHKIIDVLEPFELSKKKSDVMSGILALYIRHMTSTGLREVPVACSI